MKNDFFTDKNGNPIYVLGLQSHNSSTSTYMMDKTIDAVKLFNGNTIEAPVYWYACEPAEGSYDYSSVKELITKVRESRLHLIILWFGFNKNGHPNYAPDYIKLNPDRYRLAHGMNGAPVASMAPDCEATLNADRKAFEGLVQFIKDFDKEERTVIAIQVENEIGFANTDMDYSKEALELYHAPLPDSMKDIVIEDSFSDIDAGDSLTWKGHFGRHSHEAFSAYCHALYIEAMAKAAKAIYDIPLTINVMLGEQGLEEAGHSYNSGAAVGRMLDIYKKAAPSIDIICPDMYCQPLSDYRRVCSRYSRKDNPLFIPESSFMNISPALTEIIAAAEYKAIGICCFGAESALNADGTLCDMAKSTALTMKILSTISPLLIKYHNSDNIHSLIQQEFQTESYLKLDNYHVRTKFISSQVTHWALGSQISILNPENASVLSERGRGILIQTAPFEFYLCGAGVQLEFTRRPDANDENYFGMLTSRMAGQLNYLHVEEGHFENGQFITDYIRNGDEANGDVYVHNGQLVKIQLNPEYL